MAGPEGGQFAADVWNGTATDNPGLSTADDPARTVPALLEGKLVGGQLVAVLAAATAGGARKIRRITVTTPGSTTNVRAYVYIGDVRPENLLMGTRTGQLDYALEDPPVWVPEGSIVSVAWDPGPARALARIEYQEA